MPNLKKNFFNKSKPSLEWDGQWWVSIHRAEVGGKRDRASGLEAPSSNEAACVETGGDGLLGVVKKKDFVGACCPQVSGDFQISHAVASNRGLPHPVHTKIKNKWISSPTASRNAQQCSHYGKQSGNFLKVKYTFATGSRNSTPGNLPKRNENTCTHRPAHECSRQHYS